MKLKEIRKRFDPGVDGYALEGTEVEYLLDTCERYEAALRWYADEKNWDHGWDDCMCHDVDDNDVGKRAREALEYE